MADSAGLATMFAGLNADAVAGGGGAGGATGGGWVGTRAATGVTAGADFADGDFAAAAVAAFPVTAGPGREGGAASTRPAVPGWTATMRASPAVLSAVPSRWNSRPRKEPPGCPVGIETPGRS